jgi:hypothetical protein
MPDPVAIESGMKHATALSLSRQHTGIADGEPGRVIVAIRGGRWSCDAAPFPRYGYDASRAWRF